MRLQDAGIPPTVQTLFSAGRTLRNGDSGALVMELQQILNQLGANLVVDGQYGAATAAAVRAFQRARGITVDGIVGPVTIAHLREATGTGGLIDFLAPPAAMTTTYMPMLDLTALRAPVAAPGVDWPLVGAVTLGGLGIVLLAARSRPRRR